jgi:hypothetical protein
MTLQGRNPPIVTRLLGPHALGEIAAHKGPRF